MGRLICRRLMSQTLIRSLSVARPMSTSTWASKSVISPWKLIQKSSSPCLMLPPALDAETSSVNHSLYSLAENRVLTLPQTGLTDLMLPTDETRTRSFRYSRYSLAKYRRLLNPPLTDLMPHPLKKLTFCGSSHGWIGLFDQHTLDVYIYNPISLRHIQLPSIQNLLDYREEQEDGKDDWISAEKLILSCSPDEDELNCRVLIMYNDHFIKAVAFCCLQCKEWTPIGNTFLIDENFDYGNGNGYGRTRVGLYYQDFVHSTRQNLFFGLNESTQLETWDLSDPSSPVLLSDRDQLHCFCTPTPNHPRKSSVPNCYLVVADEIFEDEKDHVLMVTRYVGHNVDSDGSYRMIFDFSAHGPHMTLDFHICVYDQEEDDFTRLDSLGDFALFIGNCSDSVALSVTQYPELKSNSIYFTDTNMVTDSRLKDPILALGGHDIGVFDFENKTVSPCYYPCDLPNLKFIEPSPMWFFPDELQY